MGIDVSHSAWFMFYRWRRILHMQDHNGRSYNECGGWCTNHVCVRTHPVDEIRDRESRWGEQAWRARGCPYGPPSDSANSHEEYELLFFAEVPPEVADRAIDAEWNM